MQLAAPTQEDISINNDNERMIEINLWSYWAHLSIYRFALPHCTGRRVLDAGSGAGYGAAFLARHGADVLACDASTEAVAYAAERYQKQGLRYQVVDLNQPLPLRSGEFDVVFSSNVFEHIPNVDGLAAECARVVRPDGTVIVAVPPVTSAEVAEEDTRNHWHVHHLPPAAWHAKLNRFFGAIECHGHRGRGSWGDPEVQSAEIARGTEAVTIRDTDFEFPPVSIDHLNRWQCITSVFVCREPRTVPLPETLAERMPSSWCFGATVAKLLGEAQCTTIELERQGDALQHDGSPTLSACGSAPVTVRDWRQHVDQTTALLQDILSRLDAAAADRRNIAETAAMLRTTLRPARAVWRRALPLRRAVARLRGRS